MLQGTAIDVSAPETTDGPLLHGSVHGCYAGCWERLGAVRGTHLELQGLAAQVHSDSWHSIGHPFWNFIWHLILHDFAFDLTLEMTFVAFCLALFLTLYLTF